MQYKKTKNLFDPKVFYFPCRIRSKLPYQVLVMSSHPCQATVLAVEGCIALSSESTSETLDGKKKGQSQNRYMAEMCTAE